MKNNKFVLGLMLGLTFFLFMGAFSRDWIESTPTNSTVANQIDDFNRYLRVDVSDRLKSQVYGLTNGENTGNPGFKKQIFLQQSSAEGTPNANEIVFYSIDDGSNCSYYAIQEDGYIKQILKKVGSDLNFVIETADIPADLIDSVHYAANSIDPEHLVDDFTFDTFPLSPSSAPDADYELSNKKYVDDQIAAKDFGVDATDDDDSQTMVAAHAYLANQDGFVSVLFQTGPSGGASSCYGYVGATNNPAGAGTLKAQFFNAVYLSDNDKGWITFRVASGKYFEVTTSNIDSLTITWEPTGTLVKCTDQD